MTVAAAGLAVGALLVALGAYWVYPPAGLLVGGALLLVGAAFLIDVEKKP